jgi:hypothetical protein
VEYCLGVGDGGVSWEEEWHCEAVAAGVCFLYFFLGMLRVAPYLLERSEEWS